jgi:hypothetical protein
MVLTRNQKKLQMSKPENGSNDTAINNNDTTQINKPNICQTRSKKNETDSNKIDTKINNENNEDDKLNSKSKIKIKKSKFQQKPIMQSGSGLMPFTMPMNFLFFNIKKPIKKNKDESDENENENENDENNEDDDDSELIGCGDKNCEGCEICDEDEDECDEDCEGCELCDEDYDEELEEFFSYGNQIKEIKNKIPNLKISEQMKDKLLSMLKSSNLDDKRMEWFDTLTKIPFGEYSKYEVDINNIENTKEYIKNIYKNLDQSVWGMNDVKEEMLNYVTQCITQPDSKPRVLALCGQPGIGKTKIVRDGISKSLNREMRCFSMGGIKDSSTFFGFDYTYVGSKHGAIVQSLIDCKTMNPILFFDELDKISDTKEGQDIENLLIHLTDPVQEAYIWLEKNTCHVSHLIHTG